MSYASSLSPSVIFSTVYSGRFVGNKREQVLQGWCIAAALPDRFNRRAVNGDAGENQAPTKSESAIVHRSDFLQGGGLVSAAKQPPDEVEDPRLMRAHQSAEGLAITVRRLLDDVLFALVHRLLGLIERRPR